MKFHHLYLRVRDFEKSMQFYQKLAGLQVAKQFEAGGGNGAYLCNAEGETELELIAMPQGQNFEGKGFFLWEDLILIRKDSFFSQMTETLRTICCPRIKMWGKLISFVWKSP